MGSGPMTGNNQEDRSVGYVVFGLTQDNETHCVDMFASSLENGSGNPQAKIQHGMMMKVRDAYG